MCQTQSTWPGFIFLLLSIHFTKLWKRNPSLVSARDASQRTALHLAAANGHAAIIRVLLEAGADAGAENEEKNTPMHYAAINGQVEVSSTVTIMIVMGALTWLGIRDFVNTVSGGKAAACSWRISGCPQLFREDSIR